jgi:aminoglycoside phosphotransferase (APT) family kinase protein
MQVQLDSPKAVREGESLDLPRLETYLKDAIPGLDGPLEVAQFPSGFSNLTYLLSVGDRELVLRRPPFGSKVKSAHDMGREFKVLSALNPIYPAAPKPLALCDDMDVMGAEFYVMERIRGAIFRGVKPAGFEANEETVRGCCASFVKNLADLHGLDYAAAGLADMRREGSYVERQVRGWIKRYAGSKTDDIPAIDRVMSWLEKNYPADSDATLVHNDYKFDNVVLDQGDPTKIIGVLDWEMCTIGDPLMDLGTTLAYWIEKEDQNLGVVQCFLCDEPGVFSRREVADCYAEQTGRDLSNLPFYYVFAQFKLTVILQQIYYRYDQGLTKDERFAMLLPIIVALGDRAAHCLETGEM